MRCLGLDSSEVTKSTLSYSIGTLSHFVEIRIFKSLSIIPFARISVHVLSTEGKLMLLAVGFSMQGKMLQ